MDWKQEAEHLKYDEGLSWAELASTLRHYFPNLTELQVRDKVRDYIRRTDRYKGVEPNKKEVTKDQILSTLKTKRTPQQDADILHISVTEFVRQADKLTGDGYNIREAGNLIWLETSPTASGTEITEQYSGETEITFGLISDTHMCNKHQQLTYLNDFYDRCKRVGITTVYHCGDISDGYYKNRPDHIYELIRIGCDEQADYIIEHYPHREGITTKFLTGNHDSTHIKNGGSDIGRIIAKGRDDMEYLGYMNAKVWLTPQCDMDLYHPLDGGSYALSYQLQKHIDALQGGDKPRILACGHYHKNFAMYYRNIESYCVPCFEAQTTFEKGKHISVTVGGYIITVKCSQDGILKEVDQKKIFYSDMIDNDY